MSDKRLLIKLAADVEGIKAGMKQAKSSIDGFKSNVASAGKALAAFAAANVVAGIGREILDVTAKYQRFAAVLENTLGSSSAAQRSMKMIQDFAAKTPFQVDELTGAYVKLANQGFIPTAEEMRKLGDVAASTGKNFDQLTEAIIDAQTGEFERLKEFGIRASKSGDNVTFTFKGVETQTKMTSDAIRNYVLSLGDAVGVSGAMEKISQTLGGQVSNLGDSWDNFLKTVGDGNSGIMAGAVSLTKDLVDELNDLIKTKKQLEAEKTQTQESTLSDSINKMIENGKSVMEAKRIASIGIHDEIIQQKELLKKAQEEYAAIQGKVYWGRGDDGQRLVNTIYTIKSTINSLGKEFGMVDDITRDLFEKDLKNRTKGTVQDFKALEEAAQRVQGVLRFENDKIKPTAQLPAGFGGGVKPAVGGLADIFGPMKAAQDVANAQDLLAQKTDMANQKIAEQLDLWDRQASTAAALGESIGNSLAMAMSGQQSAAQALVGITQTVISELRKQALAAIIASAAKTGKNPVLSIALATAGFAAISALFGKLGRGSSGGGGGGSLGSGGSMGRGVEGGTRLESLGQRVQLVGNVQFDIAGDKLVGVLKNQDRFNSRTRTT